MKTLKRSIGMGVALLFGILLCGIASAAPVTTVWGNSAGNGVYQYDLMTGNLLQSFSPASAFNVSWNGRGVVQVGNTLYLTNAYDNHVYKMNATTGASEGVAFSISGSSGLSAIAYDGSNFWVGDYSGSNHAYLYSPSGALINTISLANCSDYCDGVEFFDGKLISNRVDGCCNGTPVPYDIYSTSGALLTSEFISNPLNSTGIAFDGTNFWTSDIYNGSLSEWNGTTGAFIQTLALQTPPGDFAIEDLSVNYSQVIPPTGVPEPATLGLFGLGMLLIGLFAGLRRRSN